MQGLFVRALAGHLGQQLLTLLPFTVLYLMHIVYSAAVLINLLGCFWLFTAKVLEDPHSSWLTSVGEISFLATCLQDELNSARSSNTRDSAAQFACRWVAFCCLSGTML